MDFEFLKTKITETDSFLTENAVHAVNIRLTLRNWLVGFYILEYEQMGEDRAAYGSKLLQRLAKELQIKGLTAPELSRCRQFYEVYKEFQSFISTNLLLTLPSNILGTLSQELEIGNFGTVSQKSGKYSEVASTYSIEIFSKISYSHFVELIKIKEDSKRRFYELLTIRSTLSVRELERQIVTLSYERIGMGRNTKDNFEELSSSIKPQTHGEAIKSIYLFDFLKLPKVELINETHLENALIQHLKDFIHELGEGFCFESRQKRILIDDEYFFVDLVFYHRILKCHVLIELKVDKFRHEYLSQLNSYVAYFNDQVKQRDDNPTIGILLCTEKGKKMVEYALSGMEEKLFVSKYLVNLPSIEILERFIESEINN